MQPTWELVIHPVDLSRHGLNPYGDSLYRVVLADTRKSRVFHKGKRRDLDRYVHQPECKGKWVLEKWASGDVLLGMTREQYAAFLLTFPDAAAEEYPEKGDYELSYVFEGNVDEGFLHAQLEMHEFRLHHMTANDRKVEIEQRQVAEEKAVDEQFTELFHA